MDFDDPIKNLICSRFANPAVQFFFTLKQQGIECIFVNFYASTEEILVVFKPNTKLVFGETVANPSLAVLDISKGVHVAGIRTCVLHPTSAAHRQLTEKQLLEAGVESGMIRLSVGLEHIGDILEDVEQVLQKICSPRLERHRK